MTPEVWTPGSQGPHVEFVRNLHRQIERYGQDVSVEVEFADGAVLNLISIVPEPGFGFITLRPHPEEEEPNEIVVPLTSITRFSIGTAEPPHRLGFVPSEPASEGS